MLTDRPESKNPLGTIIRRHTRTTERNIRHEGRTKRTDKAHESYPAPPWADPTEGGKKRARDCIPQKGDSSLSGLPSKLPRRKKTASTVEACGPLFDAQKSRVPFLLMSAENSRVPFAQSPLRCVPFALFRPPPFLCAEKKGPSRPGRGGKGQVFFVFVSSIHGEAASRAASETGFRPLPAGDCGGSDGPQPAAAITLVQARTVAGSGAGTSSIAPVVGDQTTG